MAYKATALPTELYHRGRFKVNREPHIRDIGLSFLQYIFRFRVLWYPTLYTYGYLTLGDPFICSAPLVHTRESNPVKNFRLSAVVHVDPQAFFFSWITPTTSSLAVALIVLATSSRTYRLHHLHSNVTLYDLSLA